MPTGFPPIKTENHVAVEAHLEFVFTQRVKDLFAGLLFFVDLHCKKPHLRQKLLSLACLLVRRNPLGTRGPSFPTQSAPEPRSFEPIGYTPLAPNTLLRYQCHSAVLNPAVQ
jgi:hypothetical protein